jgi:dethiobiotin synthetase
MVKGFFVTGTDTEVGKTVVSGALLRVLSSFGLQVCGMKPVETGCKRQGSMLIPADGLFLKNISEVDEALDDLAPYCFEPPLAPMVASWEEKKDIDELWLERSFDRLSDKYDALVVEGIGGLLVPITRDTSVADIARGFGLPVIVVASPFLGTINHALMTVECAIMSGLDVAGIIINYHRAPEDTLAEQTNPGVLEDLMPVPVIGILPYLKEIDKFSLEKAALDALDMDVLKRALRL